MTYVGFPVRGMEGETVYIGSKIEKSRESGNEIGRGEQKSQHGWFPRKSEFEAEKTRMGRNGG